MTTRDGYAIVLPRYRMRRLQRRIRTQGGNHPRQQAARRLLDLVVGRARRTGGRRYPVFTSRAGRRLVQIVTRATAPRRVELLYVRYAS